MTADNEFKKDINKQINKTWSSLPSAVKKIIIITTIIGTIVTVVLALLISIKTLVANPKNPNEEFQEPGIEEKNNRELTADKHDKNTKREENNCYTDNVWIPFTEEYWDHLSRFVKIGDIFSISNEDSKVDTVTYYKKSCKGSITTEVVIIPRNESFINLNIFYGSWYRWEIGGNDRRSARLYKNQNGCTAMKDVTRIQTSKTYLNNHEKIALNKPLLIKFSSYITTQGKNRTEIELEYTSDKSGKIIHEAGFFYEFDIDLQCNNNHVLNIENDYERIGIGLAKSVDPNTPPQVTLEKFKLYPYQENNQ